MGERIGGRAKGTPNKTTADVREAVAKFANGTVAEVLKMWRELAMEDGQKARAIELWARIASMVCPRPTEITGADGEPISVSISINGIVREQAKDLEPAADAGAVPRI